MRLLIASELIFLLMAVSSIAQQESTRTLRIYVVDVEGGNAALFVSPSGESLVMDTGNVGGPQRDAGRSMAAIKDAGVQRIDHLITTHWHLDHFGGMAGLANRIPIREFIDHGANVRPNPEADSFLSQTYPKLYSSAKHTVVNRGDTIPFDKIDVRVVASAGETIKSSLPGAGQVNPYCPSSNTESVDQTENGQSIGIVVTYGNFRVLHLGDFSANKEFELMCPINRIGTVDIFVVSHHGQPNSKYPTLGTRDRIAGSDHEQWPAERRRTRSHEDHSLGSGPRRSLATTLLST